MWAHFDKRSSSDTSDEVGKAFPFVVILATSLASAAGTVSMVPVNSPVAALAR